VGKGVYLLKRAATAAREPGFAALLNLEGWTGLIELTTPLRGRDLVTGATISLEGEIVSPEKPLILELFA